MGIFDHILDNFPLTREEAELLLWTAPARYKVHEIEKRNGRGVRTIAQPTAEIKLLQRLMVEKYVSKLPVSDVATAYRKGVGIADHAKLHAKNRYLLKLDFTNFFPSIRAIDFLKHLAKYGPIEKEDAKYLARLFFWRPKGERVLVLSIGAPSSPSISNTIMFDFDCAVETYCSDKAVVYSRYADDLAFSTNNPGVLNEVHDYVIALCQRIKYPSLTINVGKTVYTSKKHRRQLTGLILSNDGQPSLGREKKHLIRAMANRFRNGELSPEDVAKLRGWIAFSMSFDDRFVDAIRRMIGEDMLQRLMKI